MYARVEGVTIVGVHGHPVVVEANVGRGLPSLSVTGLPGASVQDARERVRPAVENAGLEWPLRRVVVNLSPVDLRKEGPGLDLPIAMSVVAAIGAVPHAALPGVTFSAELSLRGSLMPTPGILATTLAARAAGAHTIVVPASNRAEAAMVDGIAVVGAETVGDVAGYLRGTWRPPPPTDASAVPSIDADVPDLADIRGQVVARRALEVAAAGGHNILFLGPPGSGKTMLARRMPGILPPLTREEALEVTLMQSVAGILPGQHLAQCRPFRAPHHSVSASALLGGGVGVPRPGEVTLAHHGVLFLDEIAEFRRDALEGLRQPLEDGAVVVTRASGAVTFPARFTLVAAANPCPCGRRGDPRSRCVCPEHRIAAYAAKLSGPLLDRIDLVVTLPRLSPTELLHATPGEGTGKVRERVQRGRQRQRAALAEAGFSRNADIPGPQVRTMARCTPAAEGLLAEAVDRMRLTGRGFDRVLRVARTVADLAEADRVDIAHVSEALSYRSTSPSTEARHAV